MYESDVMSYAAMHTSVSLCKEKQEASLRKALSPIPSNMVPVNLHTSDNGNCDVVLEPQTPIEMSNIEKVPGAPLDKFNALGSVLKVCMVPHLIP